MIKILFTDLFWDLGLNVAGASITAITELIDNTFFSDIRGIFDYEKSYGGFKINLGYSALISSNNCFNIDLTYNIIPSLDYPILSSQENKLVDYINADYVSIDFLSKQSKILRNYDYYILRTGGGRFAILDEKKFPSSYLDLSISDGVQLETKEDPEFPELYKVFTKDVRDKSKQENSALEFPNALGCYDLLIKKLFGNVKWYVGPRGGKRSQFKVYGEKSNGKITSLCDLYDYNGPEELDYTIWTKDCILLFEAKVVEHENEGLDIGWFKMAYPASRFSKIDNYTTKPIYFLRCKNTIHLFVFPKFPFYNDGIIINDKKNQIPETIFRIDLA